MADLNLTPSRGATSFASSSTFPSHGISNSYVYDVFINYHGTDVKKGLASHIYRRLVAYGLRVFSDPYELQQGDNMTAQVEGAIRTASVHVAIFTPTYAESSRCLDELVLMLESGSGSGSFVPVFYKVKPSDLRWTRGAQSLGVLENKRTDDSLPRYDSSIIEKWRCALSVAADISGFELKAYYDDEGVLVDKCFQRIVRTVRKPSLDVAKYPIGLDEKVKDVEWTLSLQPQSGGVRVVGIVGLGGIGKTTLAKEFFNRQRSHYKRSCFLADVRSSFLPSLQSILLKDLFQSQVQIDSVDEGKKYLSSSNKANNALIVLDDVDHIDQLDALFSPVKDTIHPDSLMLVTSRNKDVLTSSGLAESSIYKVEGLNAQHSRELFCCHAFGNSHPVEGFDGLVKKISDVCDGVPLSLKVFGALLHGEYDLKYWNELLHKISKTSTTEIKSILKISYENLNEEEKQIFLDVACFFIGEDRDTTIRIWDGSGWEGWLSFSNLQNKCMVEVRSDNCLIMHDHLRELGRDVAATECPRRLWGLPYNLMLNPFHQSPVRGINMVIHPDDYDGYELFESLAEIAKYLSSVTDMSGLQLLRSEGYCVENILRGEQSPKLIWLCWHKCPYRFIPSSIPINNLRVLQIKGSGLETLWLNESQAPLLLRELNVDAPLVKVPNSIGKLKLLEKIVLHWTEYSKRVDLETLPDEFCQLQSLKHLELKKCEKMKSLPYYLGNLTNLQYIDLSDCSSLQMLPESFGNLTNLQYIDLSDCSSLQMLPDSFGNLTNLHHIELSHFTNLEKLPIFFGNFTHLYHIDLSQCSNLEMLPDSFANLTNLLYIDFSECSNLEMLPDSFGNLANLQHINLSQCTNLKMLPDSFGNLTNLHHMDLSQCFNLQMLPDSFENFRNLKHINLSNCSQCSHLHMVPAFFGNLTNLQHISLSRWSNLQVLPGYIGNFKCLQHIDLSWCSNLQMLPNCFGKLRNLGHINLSGCFNLEMIPDSFGELRNLQHIDLSGCSNLERIPDSFGELRNLRHIDLSRCSNLQLIPDSFGEFTNLRHIDLSWCSNLQMIPDSFGKLRNLRDIDLSGCLNLQTFPEGIWELELLD